MWRSIIRGAAFNSKNNSTFADSLHSRRNFSFIPNWFGSAEAGSTRDAYEYLPDAYVASQQKNHKNLEEVKQILRETQLEETWKRELYSSCQGVEDLHRFRGESALHRNNEGCQLIDKAWESIHDVKLKGRSLIWTHRNLRCLGRGASKKSYTTEAKDAVVPYEDVKGTLSICLDRSFDSTNAIIFGSDGLGLELTSNKVVTRKNRKVIRINEHVLAMIAGMSGFCYEVINHLSSNEDYTKSAYSCATESMRFIIAKWKDWNIPKIENEKAEEPKEPNKSKVVIVLWFACFTTGKGMIYSYDSRVNEVREESTFFKGCGATTAKRRFGILNFLENTSPDEELDLEKSIRFLKESMVSASLASMTKDQNSEAQEAPNGGVLCIEKITPQGIEQLWNGDVVLLWNGMLGDQKWYWSESDESANVGLTALVLQELSPYTSYMKMLRSQPQKVRRQMVEDLKPVLFSMQKHENNNRAMILKSHALNLKKGMLDFRVIERESLRALAVDLKRGTLGTCVHNRFIEGDYDYKNEKITQRLFEIVCKHHHIWAD